MTNICILVKKELAGNIKIHRQFFFWVTRKNSHTQSIHLPKETLVSGLDILSWIENTLNFRVPELFYTQTLNKSSNSNFRQQCQKITHLSVEMTAVKNNHWLNGWNDKRLYHMTNTCSTCSKSNFIRWTKEKKLKNMLLARVVLRFHFRSTFSNSSTCQI